MWAVFISSKYTLNMCRSRQIQQKAKNSIERKVSAKILSSAIINGDKLFDLKVYNLVSGSGDEALTVHKVALCM